MTIAYDVTIDLSLTHCHMCHHVGCHLFRLIMDYGSIQIVLTLIKLCNKTNAMRFFPDQVHKVWKFPSLLIIIMYLMHLTKLQ